MHTEGGMAVSRWQRRTAAAVALLLVAGVVFLGSGRRQEREVDVPLAGSSPLDFRLDAGGTPTVVG